jgi:TolA-binding protein
MADETRGDGAGDGGETGHGGTGGGGQGGNPDPPAGTATTSTTTSGDGDEPSLEGVSPEVQRLVRELRREASGSRVKIRELEEAAEATRRATETETDKKIREAAEEARRTTSAEYELKLAEADVLTAAAGRLHDPRDAIGHLPIAEIAAEHDPRKRGKIIGDRLEELMTEKPYLVASSSGNGPTGLVTQGARSSGARGGNEDPDAWLRRARGRR